MNFFSENLSNPCTLNEEQSRHCIKVLRAKVNQPIRVLNGKGTAAEGKISEIRKNEVIVAIDELQTPYKENPNKLSIAICIPKNPARLEWFLEKATEIGVSDIYPIISKRTEKNTIKKERLEQIIIAAGKQSGQYYFPALHPIQQLNTFLEYPFTCQKLIAHCEDHKQHLKEVYQRNSEAILLIGPEGDFTREEIALAIQSNYSPVSLGVSILRVETAGVVACTIVNALNYE